MKSVKNFPKAVVPTLAVKKEPAKRPVKELAAVVPVVPVVKEPAAVVPVSDEVKQQVKEFLSAIEKQNVNFNNASFQEEQIRRAKHAAYDQLRASKEQLMAAIKVVAKENGIDPEGPVKYEFDLDSFAFKLKA